MTPAARTRTRSLTIGITSVIAVLVVGCGGSSQPSASQTSAAPVPSSTFVNYAVQACATLATFLVDLKQHPRTNQVHFVHDVHTMQEDAQLAFNQEGGHYEQLFLDTNALAHFVESKRFATASQDSAPITKAKKDCP